MRMPISIAAVAFATATLALPAVAPTPALAQELALPSSEEMLRSFYDFTGEMPGKADRVVSRAANDPKARAAYGRFRAMGGQQDFATWARYFVANGYLVEGDRQDGDPRNMPEAGRTMTSGQPGTGPDLPPGYVPTADGAIDPQNGILYVPNADGSYTATTPNGYPYQTPAVR